LPNTITHIGTGAFSSLNSLRTLNLPDSVVEIGATAFMNYRGDGDMKVEINELPSSLTSIGYAAFQSAGPNIHISKIPAGLRIIPWGTFAQLPNFKVSSFGGILEEIGEGAFQGSGSGDWGPDIERIEIHPSVVTIGANAFDRYAEYTLKMAAFAKYDASDDGAYGATYSEMGLKVDIEALT
jgi:hypothetical protein